ncbi:hypothetical protein GUITHDRAFT_119042, partial [Guillardia theta CCMP2712]
VRIAKKSGAIIPKPPESQRRMYPRPDGGDKDTPPDVAIKKTVSERDELMHEAMKKLTILGPKCDFLREIAQIDQEQKAAWLQEKQRRMAERAQKMKQ